MVVGVAGLRWRTRWGQCYKHKATVSPQAADSKGLSSQQPDVQRTCYFETRKSKAMTINDLKIDIINVVSQVTDISILSKIRNRIKQEVEKQSTAEYSYPKDAETEIRKGITFEDLMKEQNYQKISFDDFTDCGTDDHWEVSLDDMLKYSN